MNNNSQALLSNPHLLNFMIAKHCKFHKLRLTDGLSESFDRIKQAIKADVDKSTSENKVSRLELDKLIGIEHFFQHLGKKIIYFENIGYDLIRQAYSFHSDLFKDMPQTEHAIKYNVLSECDENCTDFLSDTEVQTKSKEPKFDKKWSLAKLKNWSKSNSNI